MPRVLKSRPSTSPIQSGITTDFSTKTKICVLQFPIICKPMPRPPTYRPPPAAIEVSSSTSLALPAGKPRTCLQFCLLRALAIEPNTCSARDMRWWCPNNLVRRHLKTTCQNGPTRAWNADLTVISRTLSPSELWDQLHNPHPARQDRKDAQRGAARTCLVALICAQPYRRQGIAPTTCANNLS
jgi:hypothetical protein